MVGRMKMVEKIHKMQKLMMKGKREVVLLLDKEIKVKREVAMLLDKEMKEVVLVKGRRGIQELMIVIVIVQKVKRNFLEQSIVWQNEELSRSRADRPPSKQNRRVRPCVVQAAKDAGPA